MPGNSARPYCFQDFVAGGLFMRLIVKFSFSIFAI